MKDTVLNGFNGGLNLDSRPSMMPNGDYAMAVNTQKETFDSNNFGLVNEPSNELCFKLPNDFDYCGSAFIEERDSFLIFSYNQKTKVSQIGVGNIKSCEYTTIITDEKFINKLCFSPTEKIITELKYLRPCTDLWAYWSSNLVYYRLNIDAPTCDITYDDMVLFDCKCPSVLTVDVIDDGSELLDVGAYQFVCQLIDDDENKTNWFNISNPEVLTSEDNKLGDKSKQAFIITIDSLPKDYPKVAIAVIKTIGGIQTAEVISIQYHNGRSISYVYRGKDKDDEPIDIKEILSKKSGYIRGKDLIQRNGRLFLYNIKEEWNLDAQAYASKIKTSIIAYALPAKFAADQPTLPRGEVISLSAVYNYCDGTSSVGFHINGRTGGKEDFEVIPPSDNRNCTDCNKYAWEVENTAFIEEEYCKTSLFAKSEGQQRITQGVKTPDMVIYLPYDPSTDKSYCKNLNSDDTQPPPEGYETSECYEPENFGIGNCEDCLETQPSFDIVKGKVTCEGEECVNGYCPSTGVPCTFCSTCGNDKFRVVKISGGYTYANLADQGIDLTGGGGGCSGGDCGEPETQGLITDECPDGNCGGGGDINTDECPDGNCGGKQTSGNLIVEDCPTGEPIYDKDKCRIIGYKPAKIAKIKPGYWQSTEKYPNTKNCEGKHIYGADAGNPVRHLLMPDESLIPFHYSKNHCVVSDAQPDNYEWEDSVAIILGLEVCNVELPPNPPKPYCEHNPVSIYWQVVDPLDRRVNARGMLTSTFKGQIGNREYAVPKNAVNSLEYFDRHLDTTENGVTHFRGGEGMLLPVYNFHSPDTTFEKIPLTADKLFVPFELNGCGERYGIYGEGEEPSNMWSTTTNVRGTRQAINLNQYKTTGNTRIVTKPAKCKTDVVFTYELSACELKGQIATAYLTANVDPSLVISFRGYVNGKLMAEANSKNKLSLKLGPTGSSLHEANFTEVILYIADGTNICEYRPADKTLARFIVDPKFFNPKQCKDIEAVKVRSVTYANEEYYNVGGFTRCIKGISYAPYDSIISKGDSFTYPLLNLKREGSVYLELDGVPMTLSNSIDRFLSPNGRNQNYEYNGKEGIQADQTSDGSFLGDIGCHDCHIYNSAAHFGILLNDSPNQYGRLESATYIPLGMDLTAEEVICGKAERYGIGDSYIGLYSFRRQSLVSDKIKGQDDQYPPASGDTLTFLWGLDDIDYDDLLCRRDCSDIPLSCGSEEDRRKTINLRRFGDPDRNPECWDGRSVFPGYVGRDTYHPNTLNTLIHFWTESKINLWKRKSDICDPYHFDFDKNVPNSKGADIHYRNLKCLELDPEFRKETAWTHAWLSRIGMLSRTIALLKRFARTFIKIFTLLLIGITAVTAFGFGGIAVFLWAIFNDGFNRALCRAIDKILKVKQCTPKCYQGTENCKAPDGDLLPFTDNYSGYNWDFNTKNILETKIGMPDPYNTCICDAGEGNQIIYSAKQNPLSSTDSYKNFLVNNYINIPASSGKIQTLFSSRNNFYAHTSDMIINIAQADGVLDLGNGQSLDVLTQGGDLRSEPKELFSDVPEGYAGTRDPNAAINTQYGRFFIDREAKKIFLFNSGLQEISTVGVRNFLKENLDLALLKQFPDYKCVDEIEGIGYKLGFDHRFDKLIVTKVDWFAKKSENLDLVDGRYFRDKKNKNAVNLGDTQYFIDKGFTLSYDMNSKRWISFHSYRPDSYAWDRDHMYSIKNSEFWKHGDTYGDFQKFYGHYYPQALEFVVRRSDGLQFSFSDMELDIEADVWDGNNWIRGVEKSITNGVFYNDKQSTGNVEIIVEDPNNKLKSMKEKNDEISIKYEKELIRIHDIGDRVADKNSPIFDGKTKEGLKVVNDDNIGKKAGKMEGKYLIARLILDRPEDSNLQHIVKRVVTNLDVVNR